MDLCRTVHRRLRPAGSGGTASSMIADDASGTEGGATEAILELSVCGCDVSFCIHGGMSLQTFVTVLI